MNPIIHRSGLSVAGLLVAGGCALGPAVAAHAAPVQSAPTTSTQSDKGHDSRSERLLNVDYQAQPNFFYCGPAATRIALSAQGKQLSQDDVAALLGTTEAGTPSALDTTRVLNQLTGGKYKTGEIPDDVAKPSEVQRLRDDVMKALDDGRPVVANVRGTAVDEIGSPHSYEGGHYVTLIGYRDGGQSIQIADPADPADNEYWMPLDKVANWIASRGYSA
ncbi:phytochelatin synthase [Micromonospora musae]|uniref:Phytochelatin synthase n=1 Tax=Micromonospora musae TaxID=1894970 RepID=A0A3A9Y306_9ACTN|nr:C39 family peptidase [Micromonospora musae]RKN23917.1 phytochelatin synthase [Micromonospora musae]RKN31768.1 phytochelatin synthase [Micromonospora musae]